MNEPTYTPASDEASGTARIAELRDMIAHNVHPTLEQFDVAIERLIEDVTLDVVGEVRAEARISDVQDHPPILSRDLDDERFDFFYQ